MKRVKFLVGTAYKGPRKEGEVISVPDDFANRWVKNGIAMLIGEEPSVEKVVDTETPSEITETNIADYENMSPKDLYALCKDKGIDVEAKKSKEYYIEKLNS